MSKIKTVSGEVTALTPIAANVTLPALKINVRLGADVTAEDAMAAVETVCSAYNNQHQGLCALRVVIGKIVKEVRDRDLFRPKFSSFDAYLEHLDEKYGLSRSVVQDAILGVTVFPKVKPTDVQKMKVVNFTNAARAAKKAEPAVAERIFNEAKKLPVARFREKMEDDGFLIKRGRPDGGSRKSGAVILRIKVSATIAERFRKLAEDVAGGDEGKYFRSLLSLSTKMA